MKELPQSNVPTSPAPVTGAAPASAAAPENRRAPATAAPETPGASAATVAPETLRASAATVAPETPRGSAAMQAHPDKPWLASYPEGVAPTIDADAFGSLVDLFEDSFSRYGLRPAFASMGKTMSYRQLDRLSAALAGWLQAHGLAPGARVAIMMPNLLQYPVAIAGILRAGCVVVNINPLYTARELEYQLRDSGAQAIIILENFAATLQSVLARTSVQHVLVTALGDLLGAKGPVVNLVVRRVKKLVPPWRIDGHVPFRQALAHSAKRRFKAVRIAPNDLAFLQYTGGTTGVAKGAMLTHRNMVANTLQSEAWMMPARRARPEVDALTTVVALPLYHIFALTVCALLSVRMGGIGVLIPNARDLTSLIRDLRYYKVHAFPAVNTLYNALLVHPDFGRIDFSELVVANGGGMAIQESVARRWLAATGAPLIEGYGLSETAPSVCCNPSSNKTFTGTIGLPLPSTDVSIRDDDGRPVPVGRSGEICIRGPQVMAGYWNRPEETAEAMTEDGFFRSGDVGIMDEAGLVRIVDRKKDMILVSGFNVYPNEVEAVAVMHPGVFEAAAVAMPDGHSGEAVKLFVVRRDETLTEAELMAFCKGHLAGYKRPRAIEFRDTLPKTNVGKILRRALRGDPAQADPGAATGTPDGPGPGHV